MKRKVAIDEAQVRGFLTERLADELHAKRILSLSHATLGAVQATSLSVAAIGKAMAWARHVCEPTQVAPRAVRAGPAGVGVALPSMDRSWTTGRG